MWGSSEEEFAIDLDEEECGAALPAQAAPQATQPKRPRNAGSTPERFRPQAAVGGDAEAAAAAAATAADSCDGQPTSQPGGGWRLRSIFLGATVPGQAPQPSAPAQQGEQAAQQRQQPGSDSRAQLQPTAPPAACPLSPGLGWDDDEDVGPLTQMAAANAPVAAAFCPHCGCFLPDLGSTHTQAQHTAACGAVAAARASPAGLQRQGQGQQQQQQQQTPGGLAQAGQDEQLGAAEGSPAASEDEEEEDGNWSEQEEATQAAADGDGLAAAAAEAAGSEDGWEGGADDAAAERSSPSGGGGSADEHAQQQAADADERAALRAWLAQHGVDKYADHFERAGAGLSLLPCLTDADLQQMGIAALGARKKLLLAAEELAEAVEAAVGGGDGEQDAAEGLQWARQEEAQTGAGAGQGPAGAAAVAAAGSQYAQLLQQHAAVAAAEDERRRSHAAAGPSGVGDWRALVAGGGGAVVTSILNYFKPTGGSKPAKQAAANPGSILSYLKAPDGSSLPVPPPPVQRAAGGGGRGGGKGGQKQWAHKEVAAQGGGGGGKRSWGPRAAQVLPMRPWQLVPGTPFVVDRFCNLPQHSPYRHWFLTHFHADHYKGLNGKFDRGTLYCSPPTALLVQQQLRVKSGCIRTVKLNSPIVVEGVRVTFLDANHCPGAVMILFEPPGRRPVLHTGDCRLVADMQQEAGLQAVRGRADLILDTTYCSPEYAFPSQQEVLKFAIDAVKAEAFNPKTLFLFGSYTIGKERLFLEAARVLQRKIYVSVAKRKILDCLDLPPEYRSLLTTDDHETNLHAVPLWMVSQKHMAKLLKHYRGRFSNAVGFQPTGWTHQRDAGQTRARGRRRQKGTIITYQVPYSEHSSFSELRQFVDWFRPVSIVPSVNSDGGGPKAQRLVQLLRGPAGGGQRVAAAATAAAATAPAAAGAHRAMEAPFGGPTWHRKRCKSGRYADEITTGDLQALYHLPAEQAARLIGISCTILKKVCRKHGVQRWPYRSLKAHATAVVCRVPSGSAQAGRAAAQAGAATRPPQPGTPAGVGATAAPTTARAGTTGQSPFLVTACTADGPAFASAGSGTSMQMLLLPGSGSAQVAPPPGSGNYEAPSWGMRPSGHPALQRSYTPFAEAPGESGACGSHQFVPQGSRLAAPAANSLQPGSGDFSPSASAASLKALLKRAAALTGEESMLQALLDEIRWRRQQLAVEPAAADSTALGCLQAAVVSKLAQAEAKAAAAELRSTPAWGVRHPQQAPQSSEQSAESAAVSLGRPGLPSPRRQPAPARPQLLQLVPAAALRRVDEAKAAVPRSPFESSHLHPAAVSPLAATGSDRLPPAAAVPVPQPFVPLRPAPGRALTPATLQLVREPRAPPPLSPSLAAARLAMLQLRFTGSTAGGPFRQAQQWPLPAQQ